MSPVPIGLIAILAAAPVPPGAIRFDRVDPHRAALFVAEVFGVPLIVVGGSTEPITIGLEAKAAESALKELALAIGLSLTVEDKRFVMAPPATLAAFGKLERLRGGRPVSLSLERAEAAWALKILARADPLTLVGTLTGRVSITATKVPAREVLSALVRLAGQHAKVQGRTVTLSGPGTFPPTAVSTEDECPPVGHLSRLPPVMNCVPSSSLETSATSVVGKQRAALLRRRGSTLCAHVGIGAAVGSPSVTVAAVDADGVSFDDGTRLPLGAPAIRNCNEATLRSFKTSTNPAPAEALPAETFEWVDPSAIVVASIPCERGESDPFVEQRTRERARFEWSAGEHTVEATWVVRQQADEAGLYVRELSRQDGGTIRLVIGCP